MDVTAVLAITLALITFGLISRRIEGSILTGPILFSVFGLIAGPAARWYGAMSRQMGKCEEIRPVSDEPFAGPPGQQ